MALYYQCRINKNCILAILPIGKGARTSFTKKGLIIICFTVVKRQTEEKHNQDKISKQTLNEF